MEYLKVKLNDVIINDYCKGSVIEMLKGNAIRLIEQGFVTEVAGETPLKIEMTANNFKTPVITLMGNTVRAFVEEDEKVYLTDF